MRRGVNESLETDLRLRATVVADFALGDLITPDDPDDVVMEFLNNDCKLYETADRGRRWALNDQIRSQTLSHTDLAELRRVRSRSRYAPETPLQEALDRSLESSFDPNQLLEASAIEARALFPVTRWWGGTRKAIPSPDFGEWLVRKKNLFADARAMATDHFVGRGSTLKSLRDLYSEPEFDPIFIEGPAGIGKSASISAHLVWALDTSGATAVVLDFEDPGLDPTFLGHTVRRIVNALAAQADYGSHEWQPLVERAKAVAEGEAQTLDLVPEFTGRDAIAWCQVLADCLELAKLTAHRVLIVLDTFEQVARRGNAAVAGFRELFDALTSDHVQLIVAGRDLAPLDGLSARRLELQELTRNEARELLDAIADVKPPADVADRILAEVGFTPRAVRFAAGELVDGNDPQPVSNVSRQSKSAVAATSAPSPEHLIEFLLQSCVNPSRFPGCSRCRPSRSSG